MLVKWLYTADVPFSDEVIREWHYGEVVGTVHKFLQDYFVVRLSSGQFATVAISECKEVQP